VIEELGLPDQTLSCVADVWNGCFTVK